MTLIGQRQWSTNVFPQISSLVTFARNKPYYLGMVEQAQDRLLQLL